MTTIQPTAPRREAARNAVASAPFLGRLRHDEVVATFAMTLRPLPHLLVACALLAGCSRGNPAEQQVELMRRDACRGDTRSYFGRVNRPRLTANVAGRMVSMARRRSSPGAPVPPPQQMETAAQDEVRHILAGWEDDVAKGTHGHLCKMKVEGTTDHYVVVRHPNGKLGRWYFGSEDGELRLTDVQ